jgi:hypothetical protein
MAESMQLRLQQRAIRRQRIEDKKWDEMDAVQKKRLGMVRNTTARPHERLTRILLCLQDRQTKMNGVAPYRDKEWKSHVRHNGTTWYTGIHKTEMDASEAHDDLCARLHLKSKMNRSNVAGMNFNLNDMSVSLVLRPRLCQLAA